MIKRMLLTSLLVLLAIVAIVLKYQHYLSNPWTRDAQVRARIVEITARVTAPIIAIHVTDNSEVKAGDLLFEIDPRTYVAALAKLRPALTRLMPICSRRVMRPSAGAS